MIDLNYYDVFIFDCDGVILDSNNIKTNAFKSTLTGVSEKKINQLIKYHKRFGGISRYEKFKYFYTFINIQNDKEILIKQALEKFGSIVSKQLLEAEYLPGILNFLEEIKKKKSTCFINSGSDEKELIEIFSKRKILSLFHSVFGSPGTKIQNNKKIFKLMGRKKKYLYFGDSASDYFSTLDYNIDFIFVSGFSEWKNPQGFFKAEIKDFTTLINN